MLLAADHTRRASYGQSTARWIVPDAGTVGPVGAVPVRGKKVVRELVCEIELSKGATLKSGKAREELGQLEGRAHKPVIPDGSTPSRIGSRSSGS